MARVALECDSAYVEMVRLGPATPADGGLGSAVILTLRAPTNTGVDIVLEWQLKYIWYRDFYDIKHYFNSYEVVTVRDGRAILEYDTHEVTIGTDPVRYTVYSQARTGIELSVEEVGADLLLTISTIDGVTWSTTVPGRTLRTIDGTSDARWQVEVLVAHEHYVATSLEARIGDVARVNNLETTNFPWDSTDEFAAWNYTLYNDTTDATADGDLWVRIESHEKNKRIRLGHDVVTALLAKIAVTDRVIVTAGDGDGGGSGGDGPITCKHSLTVNDAVVADASQTPTLVSPCFGRYIELETMLGISTPRQVSSEGTVTPPDPLPPDDTEETPETEPPTLLIEGFGEPGAGGV